VSTKRKQRMYGPRDRAPKYLVVEADAVVIAEGETGTSKRRVNARDLGVSAPSGSKTAART
jgi:hypothetical protein